MPRLLRDSGLVEDDWRRLAPEEQDFGGQRILVPLDTWLAHREVLVERTPQRIGIWLGGDQEPDAIASDLVLFGCIAIHFPAFTDGRGFSCARLLRERYGYCGELRAIGDILPDQLHYLWRCGFDAFELPDEVSLDTALDCLAAFSASYQSAVREAARG